MKKLKQLICFLAALCLLTALLPCAMAEETGEPGDERFAGKTWEEVIEDFLEQHYTYAEGVGLGYYNTVTGEEQYYNPDTYYVAASMFKVPLNMLYCEMVANGEIDWDTNIWGYTYEYLLEGTIIDSNNDLAEKLWRAYGVGQNVPYRYYREQIAPYMGEDAENVDPLYYRNNLFTARQMITCLRLLYDNPDRFPRLLDTMKRAEPKRYFKNHPQKVEVAHKYGYVVEDDIFYLNDCGVCYTEDPICIVAFTRGIHEPYAFLADYCTLMIDYTEYHTALRHEEELQQAREAAILAMNPTETRVAEPGETAAAAESGETAKTEQSVRTEEKKADVRTPVMTVLIFALTAGSLATLLGLNKKKQLKLRWAIPGLLLAVAALLLCLYAPAMTPTVKTTTAASVEKTEGDPQQTVRTFFDSLMLKDYDAAYDCLYDYVSLGLEDEPESEAARLMADALRGSYSYTLYGDCAVQGMSASQQVIFEVLDLNALQEDLKAGTEAAVERLSENLPKSQVLDDKGEYLPELTERAYLEALRELLARPAKYRTSIGLELELCKTGDGWFIVTDNRLFSALSGQNTAVKGGESA